MSLVVEIFIVVLIAIGVTCLLFGIVLGAVFAKKKVTIRSMEERCLSRPRYGLHSLFTPFKYVMLVAVKHRF